MRDSGKYTSAIELECSLQSDPLASRGCLDVCLLCSIETVYIALMVLGVMKLHDLSRDVRFQCLGVVSTMIEISRNRVLFTL